MTCRTKLCSFAGIAALVLFSVQPISAQTFTESADPSPAATPQPAPSDDAHGSGRFGAGFRLSSLGLGGEVAVRVTHSSNVRGGFNFFSYSRAYDNHGIHYAANLHWASAEAHYDWFPFAHSLHLSPGLIAYNDNHVDASASVPSGQTFTLNGVSYQSDPTGTNPVNGTAKLSFNKVDPTIMVGLGNLVPRNGKHFTINIEGGIAFSGSPKIALNLAGIACPTNPPGPCQNVATNSSIQSNVKAEQTSISNDLSPLKYYPLISMTIGYRF
jgi:hypothetical protein